MTTPNTFDLSRKVAIVTGASRGIGESAAKLLAAHGAHVIVSSRKVDDCQKVVDAIVTAGGSAEAIIEGIQGTLCPAGDVRAIAGRVCQILGDERLRADLRNGTQELPEEFTIQETVKQYQSLYTYLLHATRPAQDMMKLQPNRL